MEVGQIGIGITEQFSEGIVVLPTFHHVPDRPDATDLGVDGPEIVFQLQLHGSSIDSIRFDSIRSYSMGFDSIHSAFFFRRPLTIPHSYMYMTLLECAKLHSLLRYR